MPREPFSPCTSHVWRQDKFPEEGAQLLGIYVVAYIFFGALAHYLLVNTSAILSQSEVVTERRFTPPNMKRELDNTFGSARGNFLEVLRDCYRPRGRTYFRASSPAHGTILSRRSHRNRRLTMTSGRVLPSARMAHSWRIRVRSWSFAVIRRLADLPLQFAAVRTESLGSIPKLRTRV